MTAVKSKLGLTRLLGIHYYVRDLERSRRFYTQLLDFAETGQSSPALERAGRQRSVAFEAGACAIVCSEPQGEGGRASRYLKRHPDGVGTLAFEVQDIEETFDLLDRRGGNPISEIQTEREGDSWYKTFSITTPFGIPAASFSMPCPSRGEPSCTWAMATARVCSRAWRSRPTSRLPARTRWASTRRPSPTPAS